MTTKELKSLLEQVRSFIELDRFNKEVGMGKPIDCLNKVIRTIDRGEITAEAEFKEKYGYLGTLDEYINDVLDDRNELWGKYHFLLTGEKRTY